MESWKLIYNKLIYTISFRNHLQKSFTGAWRAEAGPTFGSWWSELGGRWAEGKADVIDLEIEARTVEGKAGLGVACVRGLEELEIGVDGIH